MNYIESRIGNIIINSAGGAAGERAKTYKVSLPAALINELGIATLEKVNNNRYVNAPEAI